MTETEFAPAKINLALHVVGKRADGYHLLDSLVVFAAVGDRISADPAEGLSLRVVGPFAAGLSDEPDNLVLRAARALADLAGVPANAALTLEKNLPIASGIGGGSADAAATLRALCRLWRVAPDPAALHAMATKLGADVPVCLRGQPVRMRGIGEILDPMPNLPACGIVLANPGVAVSTAAVFKARTAAFSAPVVLPDAWPGAAALAHTLRSATNDLEPPARALCPDVDATIEALSADPTCLLARMSGSGATCFGLYETPALALAAAERLNRPGWWVWGGGLHSERHGTA